MSPAGRGGNRDKKQVNRLGKNQYFETPTDLLKRCQSSGRDRFVRFRFRPALAGADRTDIWIPLESCVADISRPSTKSLAQCGIRARPPGTAPGQLQANGKVLAEKVDWELQSIDLLHFVDAKRVSSRGKNPRLQGVKGRFR